MENTLAENKKSLENMASKEFTNELSSLIRSRYPLIYLTTNEERRMLKYFSYLSVVFGLKIFVWDCFNVLEDLDHNSIIATNDIKNPDMILEYIIKQSSSFDAQQIKTLRTQGIRGYLYILLDYYRFLEDAVSDTERRIKTFANKESITTIIATGPHYEVTPALEESFALLDFPYPNAEEIKSILWSMADGNFMVQKIPELSSKIKKQEDEIVKSAMGLTLMDTQLAFSKSLVLNKTIDIPTILKEKKQKIKKSGILDYFESDLTIDDVGGLHGLVEWIRKRKKLFKQKSLDYGLNYPKALGLVGIPGGGKSLICKVIANEYEIPLLKLDFGQVFQSYVGKSEERLRASLKLAEVLSPCALWCDELEKGMSGLGSSDMSDGGTTSRIIGTFLTWLQEKTSPVFVIATINDHFKLPPELLRAGRFDEIFFVDLPNFDERKEIFSALLKRKKTDLNKIDVDNFDLDKLSHSCEYYSGAEIEKIIDEGMVLCVEDDYRALKMDDLLSSVKNVNCLYSMRKNELDSMRDWAMGNCRFANIKMDDKSINETSVSIDLDDD